MVRTWAILGCIVTFSGIAIVYSYMHWHSVVLERRDVLNFKTVELQHAPTIVQLSGTSWNSALVVRNITTKSEGTSIVV